MQQFILGATLSTGSPIVSIGYWLIGATVHDNQFRVCSKVVGTWSGGPVIVYVFPEPVCPNANAVHENLGRDMEKESYYNNVWFEKRCKYYLNLSFYHLS